MRFGVRCYTATGGEISPKRLIAPQSGALALQGTRKLRFIAQPSKTLDGGRQSARKAVDEAEVGWWKKRTLVCNEPDTDSNFVRT